MEPEIFKPEQWTDFFLLVGTGAITLTGLVFVALSLNLKVIAQDATHRYRAVGTLTGLAAVFLRSALVLMGGQTHQAVGAEFLAVVAFGATVYVYGYIQAFKLGGSPSVARTVVGTALYLIEIFGATLFIAGLIMGLYIAAIAMVVNTCYMITGAWLLVMGTYRQKSK